MDVCEHFANAPGGHTTTQLRRLVLDFADSEFLLPDLTEKGILARCPGIEELGLTHCALDDKKGETLPILLHCLRRVDLSYTKVTGVTVRALVQKLPKGQLEWLNVSYCDMLSPDAVEWARAQGVSVKYSMGERGGGKGRKIRYA